MLNFKNEARNLKGNILVLKELKFNTNILLISIPFLLSHSEHNSNICTFTWYISGLCYAEFAARLPRAGSSYLYSYVALGEVCGFVVGWNLILEYVIAAAAAAKAWSQYIDFMMNNTINRYVYL